MINKSVLHNTSIARDFKLHGIRENRNNVFFLISYCIYGWLFLFIDDKEKKKIIDADENPE